MHSVRARYLAKRRFIILFGKNAVKSFVDYYSVFAYNINGQPDNNLADCHGGNATLFGMLITLRLSEAIPLLKKAR